MPGAAKRQLIQQAVAHQPLNSKIFQQLVDSRDDFPLEVLLNGLAILSEIGIPGTL